MKTTGFASGGGSRHLEKALPRTARRRRCGGVLCAGPPRGRAAECDFAKNADESAAILLGIYEKNPDHPGAMHYLVHANDVPGREHEELDITNKYESAAPDNPHALHMPTHIYTRLGDWDGVIRGNLLAANAALKTPAGEHGELVWDEFPHAIEYLVYAYLQKGDYDDARAQRDRPGARKTWSPASRPRFTCRPRARATRSSGRTGRKRRPSRCAPRRASPGTSFPGPRRYPALRADSARPTSANSTHARAESQRLAELDANASKAGEELSRETSACCASRWMRGPRRRKESRMRALRSCRKPRTSRRARRSIP